MRLRRMRGSAPDPAGGRACGPGRRWGITVRGGGVGGRLRRRVGRGGARFAPRVLGLGRAPGRRGR